MDEEQIAAMQAENDGYKNQIAELSTNNESMQAKMTQLLGETKQAKSDKVAADLVATKAAEAKAKEAGDFEQLHASSETARLGLEEQLKTLQSGISTEKRNNAAMKIAGELAEGANAEILSEFISRRLKHTDDGLKVTDEAGQLTVSSVDDLTQEFKNNSRFAALLKGNQAGGGGASGGDKGGSAAKEMSRADFAQMSAAKQMDFIKGGGKTFD